MVTITFIVYCFFFWVSDTDEDTLNLALVQYLFTSGEHEVKVAPHGNFNDGSARTSTVGLSFHLTRVHSTTLYRLTLYIRQCHVFVLFK